MSEEGEHPIATEPDQVEENNVEEKADGVLDGDSEAGVQAKYSRNYLLQFREMFVERPDCLPNIEIIKGFEGVVEKSGGRQGKGGGKGKGKDRSRNKGKGGRGRRDRSREPAGPVFTGPVAPLEMSENRWQKKVETGELEKLSSDTLSILNKITPEKFDVLFAKLMDLDMGTPESLTTVIDCIFDKALGEPAFCPLYATLCARLSQELPEMQDEAQEQAMSFRRLLLNKCQQEFEKEQELAEVEDEEERGKMKRRMLGNIKFIGELYLKRMLMDKIMFFCMHKLAMASEPDEEDIEALCNLLVTIGGTLETQSPKAKAPLDQTFARLKALKEAKPPVVQSRIRFMIQDLFDLRQARWRARNATDGPATLAQMRSTAAQKAENPHDAAARKAKNQRPANVHTSRRDGQRGHGSPTSGGDGWAVAGQAKPKGRSPKNNEQDEWEVQGTSRSRGSRAEPRQRGGKGGRQDVRTQQKPKPAAKPKVVSTNAFALMGEESEESEESEEEEATEEEVSPTTSVSPAPAMDSAGFAKKLRSIVDEYLASSDETEACECFKELDASDELLSSLATEAVLHVMEKKEDQRTKVNELLVHLCKGAVTTEEHMVAGVSALMEQVPDLAMDVPMFGQYVARTVGTLMARGVMKPAAVKGLFESVCGTSQGAKMFVWLFDCVAVLASVEEAKSQYEQCGMTGSSVMHEEDRNESEYKIVLERSKCQNKLEWLFGLE